MAKIITDTGLQQIRPVAEVVNVQTGEDLGAYGSVDMVSGKEERPCCMCKSFEDVDKNRIIQHVMAKGLRPRPDGKFESPIQDDFKNEKRANLVLDPKGCGYCRKDGLIVEALATCENWAPTKTLSEFQQRMMKRR